MIRKKGYSFVELIVGLMVLSSFMVLLLPKYSTAIEKTKLSEGINILKALSEAQMVYQFEHHVYTDNLPDLDVEIPSPLQHFDDPTLTIPAFAGDHFVRIRRNNGTYRLGIHEDGTLHCHATAGNDGICQKLGIPEP